MDWPVERTATQAADQPDGVLSDLNFGEVFPFVVKPLAKDYLTRYVGPLLASGRVAPVIEQVLPLDRIAEAYDLVASDTTFGKVILDCS